MRWVKQWWRQSDHYDWLMGYVKFRGLSGLVRTMIAAVAIMSTFIPIALMTVPEGPVGVVAARVRRAGRPVRLAVHDGGRGVLLGGGGVLVLDAVCRAHGAVVQVGGQQLGQPVQFGAGIGIGPGGQCAQPGVHLTHRLRIGAAGQLRLAQPQPAVHLVADA